MFSSDSIEVGKGGLISESFLFWLKSPKMGAKLWPWALLAKREHAQGRDLAPVFGDLSRSEKPSEIEPPLALDWAGT